MQAKHWSLILLVAYTLSGVTSLSLEILWARMISIQLGISIFGVVCTVAAIMLGLGAGSCLGRRLASRIHSPLRVYAWMELGIAGYALLLLVVMHQLGQMIDSMVPLLGAMQWYLFQALIFMILLLIPAIIMGAGFPMVLQAVRNSRLTVGIIYGFNTIGGVIGALLPLGLMPWLGWERSTIIIAALGVLVSVILFILSTKEEGREASVVEKLASQKNSTLDYLFYGGIGLAALMLEIGWTRLYGMVLLRTEYVLGIILAVYLAGIAIGSMVAKRLMIGRIISWLPFAAALLALLSLAGLPALASWVETSTVSSLYQALITQGLGIAILTLPVTLILGAWLPLIVTKTGQGKTVGANLYGVNAIGGALGAIIAGFIVIPVFGTTASIVLASVMLFVFGMRWSESRLSWGLGIIVVFAGGILWEMPAVSMLMPSAHGHSKTMLVHEDAVSITHVVEEPDGQRVLLSDLKRMDASTDPDAVVVQQDQGRLPLMLHRAPEKALFLGLGTGISVSGVAPYIEKLSVTAVELSEGAILAARRYFTVQNQEILDRVDVVRDDIRHYLMATPDRYDVIVGDVFHPDLSGRSTLLSVQHFDRVKRHLDEGGVYVQWLAINQFDVEGLQTVMRGFQQVFPDNDLFVVGFRVALVGYFNRDHQTGLMSHLLALPQNKQLTITGGEGVWSWMGRYWGKVSLLSGSVEDIWNPVLEYRLPHLRYLDRPPVADVLAWLQRGRTSMLSASRELGIQPADMNSFERGYAATTLLLQSWIEDLHGRSNESARLIRLAYEANSANRWAGMGLADRMLDTLPVAMHRGRDEQALLEEILKVREDHGETLRRLWHLAESEKDHERATLYRERYRKVDPMSRDFARDEGHS